MIKCEICGKKDWEVFYQDDPRSPTKTIPAHRSCYKYRQVMLEHFNKTGIPNSESKRWNKN